MPEAVVRHRGERDPGTLVLRLSHALVGGLGMAVFWIPAIARKGSLLHVRAGRIFVGCAYYAGVTGLIASIWGIVHPASFAPEAAEITAEERRRLFEQLGHPVRRLTRTVVGPVSVRGLRPGELRELTAGELGALLDGLDE